MHQLGRGLVLSILLQILTTLACGSSQAAINTATSKPQPSPTVDSRPHELILDGMKVIGAFPPDVEKLLGKPSEVDKVSAQNANYDGIVNGGEQAFYKIGSYLINVDFDAKRGAVGFGLEGLLGENWLLNDWPVILGRVNLSIQMQPDVSNDANLIWRDAEGYNVVIANDKVGGTVTGLSVWLCKYSLTDPCQP